MSGSVEIKLTRPNRRCSTIRVKRREGSGRRPARGSTKAWPDMTGHSGTASRRAAAAHEPGPLRPNLVPWLLTRAPGEGRHRRQSSAAAGQETGAPANGAVGRAPAGMQPHQPSFWSSAGPTGSLRRSAARRVPYCLIPGPLLAAPDLPCRGADAAPAHGRTDPNPTLNHYRAPARESTLVEDATISPFRGLPATVAFAIAFGVFSPSPPSLTALALTRIAGAARPLRSSSHGLSRPGGDRRAQSLRQPTAFVTHPRPEPPWHSDREGAC